MSFAADCVLDLTGSELKYGLVTSTQYLKWNSRSQVLPWEMNMRYGERGSYCDAAPFAKVLRKTLTAHLNKD